MAALRQVGEQTSKILVAAQEAGEAIKEEARRSAEQLVAGAKAESEKLAAGAKADAASILTEARAQAAAVHAQAEAERTAVETDLKHLRESRSLLATQLEDVRRRLDEMIARLQGQIEGWPPPKGPEKASEPARRQPPGKTEAKEDAPAGRSGPPAPEARAPAPPAPTPSTAPPSKPPGKPFEQAKAASSPAPAPANSSPSSPAAAKDEEPGLASLLADIRREREESRAQVERALKEAGVEPATQARAEEPTQKMPAPKAEAATEPEPAPKPSEPRGQQPPAPEAASFAPARKEALGDIPANAARRLKRLLQEDQNVLLDRLRRQRARGSFDKEISPQGEHASRFEAGLGETLRSAFSAGRKAGGAADAPKNTEVVTALINNQLINPLRKDLAHAIETGQQASDKPNVIAERTSDVFRVWKGVRAEMLGEGLVHSAYHHGLIDAWRATGVTHKRWMSDREELNCPKGICRSNSDAGEVALDHPFPSGHLAPPAHGACSCTLSGNS